MVHLCGSSDSEPRTLHARPRNRDPAHGLVPIGWLRTADGQGLALPECPAPALPLHPSRPPAREDFDNPTLPLDFQWLRSPWPEELFSLTERPGHLRLFGRETIGSQFRQSLVARRQQAHCFSAATVIDFEPDRFQQMAGLVYYYNGSKFHYLYVSHDDALGKHLRVFSCLPDQIQSDVFTPPVSIPSGIPVHLRAEIDYERLYFAYRVEDGDWPRMPGPLDASILSDEAAPAGSPNFTGAFVGICCQDLAGSRRHADFDCFGYRERACRAGPCDDAET